MQTKRVPLRDAHRGLAELVGRARWGGESFVLTSRGEDAVALIPIRDFQQIETAVNGDSEQETK
jgi:prevent-host-death family protein